MPSWGAIPSENSCTGAFCTGAFRMPCLFGGRIPPPGWHRRPPPHWPIPGHPPCPSGGPAGSYPTSPLGRVGARPNPGMRHGKGGHLEKKPGDLGFETRKLAISYRNSQLRAIAAAIATQSPFMQSCACVCSHARACAVVRVRECAVVLTMHTPLPEKNVPPSSTSKRTRDSSRCR